MTSSSEMKIRKDNAAKLKSGYSAEKRMMETGFCTSFVILWVLNFVRIAKEASEMRTEVIVTNGIIAVVMGEIIADFMSGLVHWGADTWGSTETPVLGTFIRSFREHHVNAHAMCDHDWIETNGDNNMLCVPTLIWMLATTATEQGAWYCPGTMTWQMYCLVLTLLVSLTNQFHKQAHQLNPHPISRFLMATNLVLTRQNHAVHHRGIHDQSYCITTGWLNPFLDLIDFWRKLEWVITKTTGYIPRENDIQLLGKAE
eukprot:TRINITY_DN1213_c6_g1_i1.p1 TRINITY_DN1213_c6_g1~~TRINITY_DN1213_c6_g1_i1.p1  ORF type:complete len:257 (+),score=31.43 TRINITY_DN1213_c6_g1_i1:61-831(+)